MQSHCELFARALAATSPPTVSPPALAPALCPSHTMNLAVPSLHAVPIRVLGMCVLSLSFHFVSDFFLSFFFPLSRVQHPHHHLATPDSPPVSSRSPCSPCRDLTLPSPHLHLDLHLAWPVPASLTHPRRALTALLPLRARTVSSRCCVLTVTVPALRRPLLPAALRLHPCCTCVCLFGMCFPLLLFYFHC